MKTKELINAIRQKSQNPHIYVIEHEPSRWSVQVMEEETGLAEEVAVKQTEDEAIKLGRELADENGIALIVFND